MRAIHTLEQSLNRYQTMGPIHTLEQSLNRYQNMKAMHTLEQSLNRMSQPAALNRLFKVTFVLHPNCISMPLPSLQPALCHFGNSRLVPVPVSVPLAA